jgi:nucleoside-diphosphate-sugar epimerase
LRILVTGAAGFTGVHFIEAARAAGHEPVALQADLRDAEAVISEITGLRPDAAVHLAGLSFVAVADERAFYDVNLFGSLNVLEGLKRCGGLKKVLLASSANLYGNSELSPLREDQAPSPVNHYSMSKLAMECMGKAMAGGMPLVITRPFNYTGPGQAPQFVVPKLVRHFRDRAPTVKLGNLHVEREYNDVRFVCDAYLALLDPAVATGTYNVCTGVTYTLAALLGQLQAITGHHIEAEVDPAFVRPNEIHRLCGDPGALRRAVGSRATYSIEQTLSWMLSAPPA